jgi:hypothetical protein
MSFYDWELSVQPVALWVFTAAMTVVLFGFKDLFLFHYFPFFLIYQMKNLAPGSSF